MATLLELGNQIALNASLEGTMKDGLINAMGYRDDLYQDARHFLIQCLLAYSEIDTDIEKSCTISINEQGIFKASFNVPIGLLQIRPDRLGKISMFGDNDPNTISQAIN